MHAVWFKLLCFLLSFFLIRDEYSESITILCHTLSYFLLDSIVFFPLLSIVDKTIDSIHKLIGCEICHWSCRKCHKYLLYFTHKQHPKRSINKIAEQSAFEFFKIRTINFGNVRMQLQVQVNKVQARFPWPVEWPYLPEKCSSKTKSVFMQREKSFREVPSYSAQCTHTACFE